MTTLDCLDTGYPHINKESTGIIHTDDYQKILADIGEREREVDRDTDRQTSRLTEKQGELRKMATF